MVFESVWSQGDQKHSPDALSWRTRLLYRIDGLDDGYYALLLMSPLLAILMLVAAYPLAKTIYLSFYSMPMAQPWLGQRFVGLDNYVQIIQNPVFQRAVKNTLFFTVVSVFFELVFGLLAALILSETFKGRGWLRTAVLLPWAIPLVVQGLSFKFMFNADYGIVNYLLTQVGLINGYINWLGHADTAMFAVIFSDIWKSFPFMALLILASLQTIDRDLYKSAKVDGAGMLSRFRHITLPHVKNAILISLLFRTIRAMKVFGVIYIMTAGGPANATKSVSILTVEKTFEQLYFGKGAAMGVLVVLLILPFVFVYTINYREE
ncbi:carbohydrate ABC transporter permease [Haladaptatus sp. NG-SE-30]